MTHEEKRQKKLRAIERQAYANLCRLTPETLQKRGYTMREIAGMKAMTLEDVQQRLYYGRLEQ